MVPFKRIDQVQIARGSLIEGSIYSSNLTCQPAYSRLEAVWVLNLKTVSLSSTLVRSTCYLLSIARNRLSRRYSALILRFLLKDCANDLDKNGWPVPSVVSVFLIPTEFQKLYNVENTRNHVESPLIITGSSPLSSVRTQISVWPSLWTFPANYALKYAH